MNARTLRLLEYDKIRDILRGHAASSLGQTLLERVRPARDDRVIRARQAETAEARQLLSRDGEPPFGGLHDVREAIRRAEKGGVLAPQELLDIAETAACCRRLRRALLREPEDWPRLAEHGRSLGEFQAVESAVDQAMSDRGEVLDSASRELLQARRRVHALDEAIHRELQRIITAPAMQEALQEAIITQRNGRFCVPVRAEARHTFKGLVHDLSASGQTAFMEPISVVEVGNDLREAQSREEQEVRRVLAGISAAVGEAAGDLLASIDAAARLDAICARARLAQAQEAAAPELNTDGVIDLRQARHPLLGPAAVPIDVCIGAEGKTTLLITGPNTGGKTVTLKTVGLLTLMAQSGLQVPALPGTRLAVFDQVFADIGDEQSITQSLSTFSSHMGEIVRIINEAGSNALILLDEIGAGTDPSEGAALGKAILLELHGRGCRTMATTHYGELKVFAQSTEGFLNASVEFDLESLRPTYRVIIGLPGSSNALAIAQRLGLPKALVARARQLMGEAPQAVEQVLKEAEGARRALDRERTAAMRARRQAEEEAQRLARELRELDEKRAAAIAKPRERAQEVLQQARQTVNELLDELKAVIRECRERPPAGASAPSLAKLRRRAHEALQAAAQEVDALAAPAEAPEGPPPALERVEAGQAVYVSSVGRPGIALENGQADDEVDVHVGIMRLRVPVHALGPPEAAAAPPACREPRGRTTSRAPQEPGWDRKSVNPEIRLLGLRAAEAVSRLDEYLYDALESGHAAVRIVHGHGTGALRQAVHELLRMHAAVRSYRPGARHEGGAGVTIAELG